VASNTTQSAVALVIPAFNEERYLAQTLAAVRNALAQVDGEDGPAGRAVVVVDDRSTDSTARVARAGGATVVPGTHGGIGAARNLGVRSTDAALVVFVDADTIIPSTALATVVELHRRGVKAMAIPGVYESDRTSVALLFKLWAWYAPRHDLTQGIFQAFDRALFDSLGGYREDLRMAEDTDLFDRAIGQLREHEWKIISELRVRPSMRRYEQTSALRLWLLTNPVTTRLLRRNDRLWRAWFTDPPR